MWDIPLSFDNSASRNILKVDYTPDFDKVVIGMVHSMIKTGALQHPNPKQD